MKVEDAFREPLEDPNSTARHVFAVKTDADRWIIFEALPVGVSYTEAAMLRTLEEQRARTLDPLSRLFPWVFR